MMDSREFVTSLSDLFLRDRITAAVVEQNGAPDPETDPATYGTLRGLFPADASAHEVEAGMLLAELFACHPHHGDLTLPAAIERYCQQHPQQQATIEARFRSLPESSPEQRESHLLYLVQKLGRDRIALDWVALLDALLQRSF